MLAFMSFTMMTLVSCGTANDSPYPSASASVSIPEDSAGDISTKEYIEVPEIVYVGTDSPDDWTCVIDALRWVDDNGIEYSWSAIMSDLFYEPMFTVFRDEDTLKIYVTCEGSVFTKVEENFPDAGKVEYVIDEATNSVCMAEDEFFTREFINNFFNSYLIGSTLNEIDAIGNENTVLRQDMFLADGSKPQGDTYLLDKWAELPTFSRLYPDCQFQIVDYDYLTPMPTADHSYVLGFLFPNEVVDIPSFIRYEEVNDGYNLTFFCPSVDDIECLSIYDNDVCRLFEDLINLITHYEYSETSTVICASQAAWQQKKDRFERYSWCEPGETAKCFAQMCEMQAGFIKNSYNESHSPFVFQAHSYTDTESGHLRLAIGIYGKLIGVFDIETVEATE